MKPLLKIAILVAAFFIPGFNPVSAQKVFEGSQQGLPPFGSFHGSSFDNVSLQNGNLHIEIPILSVAQRNGRVFTYRYIYDTRTFTIYWLPNENYPPMLPRGWWIVDPGYVGEADWRQTHPWSHGSSYDMECKLCGGVTSYCVKKNWQITDPDGTQHQVGLKQVDPPVACESTSGTWSPTLDGTGMILDTSAGWSGPSKIFLRDGTRVDSFPTSFTDSNGNTAQMSSDMLLRNLLVATSQTNITYVSPLGRNVSGPQYTEWTVKDSDGNAQVWRIDYQAVDFKTALCADPTPLPDGPCIETSGAFLRPMKLTLPNSKFYRFYWKQPATLNDPGHGELTQIDLPTGGSIAYSYTTKRFRPPSADRYASYSSRRAVTSRAVTPGGTWTYSYSTGISGVTNPDGSAESHTFAYFCTAPNSSSSRYETQVSFSDGTTTLRTITKDYAYEMAPDYPNPRCEANVRVIRETTQLNDTNQWGKVETDYETFTYPLGTATRLNVTERREYDYGVGAAGPLVRKTTQTYLHTGNSNYLNRNIVDKVVTTSIYDGGGVLKAQTTNEYDGYTTGGGEGIEAANAVQHDSTNYGTGFIYRGNVTAVRRWRNTDGAWLETRNLRFDTTGNVLKIRDPGNHVTTFNYDNAWYQISCAPAGNARAYLKSATNHLGHITSFTHYPCTGFIGSGTDPNNQTATFNYDFMNRPNVTNLPGGGQVDRDYGDTARIVTVKTKRTASEWLVSKAHHDVLGRVWRTELCENGSPSCAPSIKTDTTFDALGRVWKPSSGVVTPTRWGG